MTKYSRLPTLVLVCALALPAAAAWAKTSANNTCNDRPCVQIGTFNVYWLGAAERSDQGLRTQEDVEQLVDLIVELGLEVVALQEINTDITEIVDSQTVRSTQQWEWLRQALRRAGYDTVTGFAGGDQRVVVAHHKKSVKRLRSQNLLVSTSFDFGDGCRSAGLRAPLAARFRADKLEFWFVALHLKSQIGGDCADRVRERQANQLVDAVDDQLDAAGEHVFLAGDFNAPARDASLSSLRRRGKFKELTKRAQRAPGSGTVSYLLDPFRSLIDLVLYRQRDSRKVWVKKSTVIFDPETAGDEYADFPADYSDHAPVLTSIYTDRVR